MAVFSDSSQIAFNMVEMGIKKAARPAGREFLLAILAGVYIGLAAHFSTLAAAGEVPWLGLKKIIQGLVFSLGLILVVIPGAELFTGNCLLSAAVLEKKVRPAAMVKNWLLVWTGNFAGALFMAVFIVLGTGLVRGIFAEAALEIAAAKCALPGWTIFIRGIGANWLVCLGVLMAMASGDAAGKILGMIFPVTAFVAMGFEHGIANMYFIPAALLLNPQGYPALNWINGIKNIIIATGGNIVGGAFFVGALYWFIYVRPPKASKK
ncbi:MAG: formate/nitrite transporter family protein [Spirochaetales bacterium]|jgi:formate/nitrite transporter|nr:formate/nitrite transporter family protein [Spirochaetales bacterium]